jgi:hypothetical protein
MKNNTLLAVFACAATLCPASMAQQPDMGNLQQQIQQLQNMPPDERAALMDSMQQNATAVQQCLGDAGGEEALQELQTISEAHIQQAASLCASGNREEAQAYAQDASQEMLQDPRVRKLRDCSRMALQNMPQLAQLAETGGINTHKHVCD